MPRKHLLVVDDDPAILELIARLLARLQCTCQTTTSPAQALDSLAVADFDLVLTDLHMPDMNGMVLAAEIKKLKTVPVVLMTGSTPPSTSSAIDRVLLKPFSFAQLREALGLNNSSK